MSNGQPRLGRPESCKGQFHPIIAPILHDHLALHWPKKKEEARVRIKSKNPGRIFVNKFALRKKIHTPLIDEY